MTFSFYWHDYETWGADPRRDRPSQFAGVRTDAELNPIGDPLVVYCKPSDDMLPQPEACMVTGITPQKALREGLIEADFIHRIHHELAKPETCGVGYNTIRFDDEVTRNTLYRNFYDPYAREWQNGSSRWDIIDMVRLTHALRPEGIEWPQNEEGVTSFRLEVLSAANNISHESAHDALSDVHATIGLARLIRERQPKLYDYLFKSRNKNTIADRLNLRRREAVLHVSSMYSAARGCIAMVVPLAKHPTNPNGVVVYDLRYDPAPLLGLSEDEMHERLFTPAAALPEGVERIPLKTVHINKCPVVVPLSTLTDAAAKRWHIDVEQGERYRRQLLAAPGLPNKIRNVHQKVQFDPITDPDQALYSGGFFTRDDRKRMDQILTTDPASLAQFPLVFDDSRLPEMLFRYRARNWPQLLTAEEQQRWQEFRRSRLLDRDGGGSITLDEFLAKLDSLEADSQLSAERQALIAQLLAWAEQIAPD
ncbi:MAG: exodeoxyribonuclease I [gamma proteobacterium symbiont of Ctena orbiculata]|uniref:Exodeoxyribonuclease I n=1 Tax=Candidatus Thiodiazotropha taylori TaxID=2792791 RepID=A0A944M5L5_9GAMM|nr:exodeoxyribonuclease I [Candidatus Thiodiazotropha taylori]PUB86594.1 MAG: exodeoxyribonuclease I [gamma proteobacterium symbiont of Ctena orbiculata]MBT2987906.1 exodeoxyribonuclease I [Candidatus Thiodiazotropha taylori]MBT2997551.1 exodeoxyribonuclease I [Candidatus Thiodiazotropha taylori]MBT2999023.1 exodeoxyribonuclease I [Candidatus Thiodiazotropha taylori]